MASIRTVLCPKIDVVFFNVLFSEKNFDLKAYCKKKTTADGVGPRGIVSFGGSSPM